MAGPGIRVRVVEVVTETPEAHSLVLEPVEPEPQPLDYRPGQFLTVRIPSERPGGAARSYSLSSSPARDEKLKVTVKRTRDGFGSNWICDNVVEGDTLEVLRPAGLFTPASLDEDLLLFAGGSGITPVMSILKSCLYAGTGSVTLVYANSNEASVIFADELAALAREHGPRLHVVHWLESVQGLPTTTGIRALVEPYAGRQAFICGPEPFMDLATTCLGELGVQGDRIHLERFSSLEGNPFEYDEPEIDTSAPSGTVEVELDGTTSTLAWPSTSKLLDVLLAAGLDAPFSCREGNCSACACVLLEGDVALERNEILDQADLDDGIILGCQALPRSTHVRVSYDT